MWKISIGRNKTFWTDYKQLDPKTDLKFSEGKFVKGKKANLIFYENHKYSLKALRENSKKVEYGEYYCSKKRCSKRIIEYLRQPSHEILEDLYFVLKREHGCQQQQRNDNKPPPISLVENRNFIFYNNQQQKQQQQQYQYYENKFTHFVQNYNNNNNLFMMDQQQQQYSNNNNNSNLQYLQNNNNNMNNFPKLDLNTPSEIFDVVGEEINSFEEEENNDEYNISFDDDLCSYDDSDNGEKEKLEYYEEISF